MVSRNKTLIFGGAGFVGNSLTQHLYDRGVDTVVVDSQRRLDRYAKPTPNVKFIPFDWSKTSWLPILSEVQNVVQLAWTTNPATSMTSVLDDAESNILGTIKLLEQASKYNIKKFLFMSSGGTVYGNSTTPSIDECHPTAPVSAYGISKLSCENYVSLYANRNNFSHLNIRLGNPYGTYQLQGTPIGAIANFILRASKGDKLDIFGKGETIRDFIHIDDVAHSLYLALITDDISGTYNLGSGQGYSIGEIVRKIQNHFDAPISSNHLPARSSDVLSVVLESKKIQNAINYLPKINIDDGIASLCQECKSLHGHRELSSLESISSTM